VFSKVLIANRGEIAVRVARTCRELAVATVAVYSDVDSKARHVAACDEAVHLPGSSPVETYLNVGRILEAATSTGAQAIHPGYGFLSERGDVASRVAEAGLVWIGPPPEATLAAGDKLEARRLAMSAGVDPVPGTLEPAKGTDEVLAFGVEHGYPVAIKAAGGGGGRGLKVARFAEEVQDALDSASREAQAYFGSADVYLERYLEHPKHIEVQVLSPAPGAAMWLGARDCSLQRRHQKLVEETPPPRFGHLVPAIGDAAVRVANACGYVNAGTVEFLVDPDADDGRGRFYFLEVNARLQVEHTITEEVLGLDLVACQLRIAAGEPLGFDTTDLATGGRHAPRGHAIECRINAEDPSKNFLPSPGRLDGYREPGGAGVRVDSGFGEGDDVPREYDSLIAKLVVWGADREEARRRTLRALAEFDIRGLPTTLPAHLLMLASPEFVDGSYSTRTVESGVLHPLAGSVAEEDEGLSGAVLMVGDTPARLWNPAMAGSASAAVRGPSGPDRGRIVAPMHGTILKVLVAPGDTVAAGDPVAVLEAMKMETHIAAGSAGTVAEVRTEPGRVVEAGEVVAVVG
jgi:acetyl-CoA/propionyl-CoA carboxylase biotin carboxyl carrier protein